MRISRVIVCIAVSLVFAAACTGGKKDPAVKRDIERYRTVISKLSEMEVNALEDNKKAIQTPGVTDAQYAKLIHDRTLPLLEAYYLQLEKVRPVTAVVSELHALGLKRVSALIGYFKDIEQAARTQSKQLIDSANAKMAESNIYYKEWKTKIDELNKLYPRKERS